MILPQSVVGAAIFSSSRHGAFVSSVSAFAVCASRKNSVPAISPFLRSQYSTSQLRSSKGNNLVVEQGGSEATRKHPSSLKSYKMQGVSTTPATAIITNNSNNSNKNKRPRPRRRRMCGPGVTISTNTHHTLQTDIPKSMGGTNTAPQPVETLLAALLGCTQATAIFVARQLQLEILKMEFDDMVAIRDEQGALSLPIDKVPDIPSRVQEITGTVRVYTPETIPMEKLELLKEQTEARCPVANMMIASGCQMNVEWVQEVLENES